MKRNGRSRHKGLFLDFICTLAGLLSNIAAAKGVHPKNSISTGPKTAAAISYFSKQVKVITRGLSRISEITFFPSLRGILVTTQTVLTTNKNTCVVFIAVQSGAAWALIKKGRRYLREISYKSTCLILY